MMKLTCSRLAPIGYQNWPKDAIIGMIKLTASVSNF
jgi:hypothetical protein